MIQGFIFFFFMFTLKTNLIGMAFRALYDLAPATYNIPRLEPTTTFTCSALEPPLTI